MNACQIFAISKTIETVSKGQPPDMVIDPRISVQSSFKLIETSETDHGA
jgi:hypothetical protein